MQKLIKFLLITIVFLQLGCSHKTAKTVATTETQSVEPAQPVPPTPPIVPKQPTSVNEATKTETKTTVEKVDELINQQNKLPLNPNVRTGILPNIMCKKIANQKIELNSD